jgi:uncharacterized protein
MTTQEVKVAVITGGHSFDIIRFHELFRRLDGVNAYIQHMDDFASSSQAVRKGYDVVLLYIMLMDGPVDDNLPWHAGKPKSALEELGESSQGIVVLHHALLAYPKWPRWGELVGMDDRSFGYDHDQSIRVKVAAVDHPITRGMQDWEMVDETYKMGNPGLQNQVLLTTQHPLSMNALAWTQSYKQSRVFCFQSGHDDQTWRNDCFQEVLRRGILWSAGKI